MSITPLTPPRAVKPVETPRTARDFQWIWAPAVFGVLTFAMFFDLLFVADRVISSVTTDLSMQFLPWREFGFGQIKQGNFPLWNPYAYGGQPYFAGFQSALLYPPNWLHLFLSVPVAINWIVALHVFALGYFMYFWCRGREVGIAGSILAGVMVMFSGPYFLHIYAGHLPHLAIIVWAPLMLLALDKLSATGSIRWALFGVFVTSMQILAGHPQYVYYTGITLSIYVAILLIHSPKRLELAGGFVLMYVGAVLVSAVQLFAGIQAAGEFVRGAGTDYNFAATFSLPWANLITLFVPTFFQNIPMNETGRELPYWAEGYLWEMSLFISISGLMLAVLGAIRGRKQRGLVLVAMVLVTLTFALGRNTFLYRAMFDYLPGYASFRGTVKFAYLCVMFISMMAAMGVDSLLAQRKVHLGFLGGVAGLGIMLFIMAGLISRSAGDGPKGGWGRFVTAVVNEGIIDPIKRASDIYNPAVLDWNGGIDLRSDTQKLTSVGEYSAQYTCLAGGVLLLVAVLLWASRFHRLIPYSLIVLASIEMFCFARATRATMDPLVSRGVPPAWADALSKIRNTDYRVIIYPLQFWARGMYYGFENLTGNDPGIIRRYAELMFKAAQDPNPVEQYVPVTQELVNNLKVMRILRCPFLFLNTQNPPSQLLSDPFPIAVLFSEWEMIRNPRDALTRTATGQYDPAKIVVVEEPPDVPMMPAATPPGTVELVGRTTDSLEFKVDLQRNAILLVTDNYSTGWRVVPIESEQREIKVIPANYCQLGIPLRAGKHHFTVEYSPLAFRVGRWVSILSILGFGAWAIWLMRRSIKGR